MVTHVRMRTLPSSPATPPPRYRIISEFDAAGSFGVDPVTGEVFIATKLDFDVRYVNCHTDNGPPIENGSVSCCFRSPGFITANLIVAIGCPLVWKWSLPENIHYWGRNQFGIALTPFCFYFVCNRQND